MAPDEHIRRPPAGSSDVLGEIYEIVVAHRLSTVRRADRIIVLGRGWLVQPGNYEELIAQPGACRDLAMRQLT